MKREEELITMSITMIWAMDEQRLIGKDNEMPWHIPNDMAYFRKMTRGKTVVMGRKTFDSLSGALPNRRNIVVTCNQAWKPQDAETVHDIHDVLPLAEQDELMIIGGAQIYKQFMPYADKLLITRIDETFDGDAYFPEYDETEWKCVGEEQGTVDDKNKYRHRFLTYVRNR